MRVLMTADAVGGDYQYVARCLRRLVADGVLDRDPVRKFHQAYSYQYIGESVLTADRFLTDVLASGQRPSTEIRSLAKRYGIADRTLDRAKGRLGVQARKIGRTWFWELD